MQQTYSLRQMKVFNIIYVATTKLSREKTSAVFMDFQQTMKLYHTNF